MKSLWNESQAQDLAGDDLALRVYTSRLLGQRPDLVLHGGGNTSVKGEMTDFFGRPVPTLWVKGSGWDLKTIEKPGFAPLRLEETQRLAERATLSDDDMARQLRNLLLDQSAPGPSVEAILHALLPFKFVDHTHTDAVVTISNTPTGEEAIRALYPDCLVLPYIMPGFILAKQVHDAVAHHDLRAQGTKGIILLHHGVFTFGDDARSAYEDMIELVTRAEDHIAAKAPEAQAEATTTASLIDLARIRRAVSRCRGKAQLARLDASPKAAGYASRGDVATIATRGPITPDHVIRTKRIPAVIAPDVDAEVSEIPAYAADYQSYFERNRSGDLRILDPAPRFAVWRERGLIAFGSSLKECDIVADITRHTASAIQVGEALGGWQALSEAEIFELEYWVLEQAKLGKAKAEKPHQGKVALVTGAASGIGRATVERLHQDGAVVAALDLDPAVTERFEAPGILALPCDVRDSASVERAVDATVAQFGGLDYVVSCAGIFEAGKRIEALGDEWERSLDINLSGTQRLLKSAIPYLQLGVDAAIILMGSRNVPGPGAGASAYSVSKAALTQLARVAALELAPHDVRVNVLHPDAVFDTGLWTAAALQRSADRYGMTVEQYKTKNLLGREILSADVATLVSTVAGPAFRSTTGAQIPIDGGSDRVI